MHPKLVVDVGASTRVQGRADLLRRRRGSRDVHAHGRHQRHQLLRHGAAQGRRAPRRGAAAARRVSGEPGRAPGRGRGPPPSDAIRYDMLVVAV